jgi:DNA-binding XRE family transcriptional regulator
MKKSKLDRLRAAGWKVGSTKDFLGLSNEEIALIELKLSLADLLREERQSQGLTQAAVAKQIGSSQSRLAKLEAGEASVSLDLMFRVAFSLGLTRASIGKAVGRSPHPHGASMKAG